MKSAFESAATKRSYQLWLAAGLIFLTFFRAGNAFQVTGPFDDTCYVEWLYYFLGVPVEHCYADYYFPGSALLWWPGGWLAIALAKFSSTALAVWIPISIAFSSFACWVASLFVLNRLFLRHAPKALQGVSWTILFLLGIPVLSFATSRTCMSHAPELLLMLLAVYSLLEKRYPLTLFFAGLVTLTRLNDAILFGLLVGEILDRMKLIRVRALTSRERRWLGFTLIVVIAASIPVVYMSVIKGYGGSASRLGPVLRDITPWKIWRLIGDSQGSLLYSGPWWLLTLGFGIVHFVQLSWKARASLAWMGIMLLICMGWGPQAGDLGYRYLIGAYVAALLVWFELVPLLSPSMNRLFRGALVAQSLWLTHITWLSGKRYPNLWYVMQEAIQQHSVIRFVRGVIEPITLMGLSPTGLALYSHFPKTISRIGLSPHSELTGPGVWVITITAVMALVGTAYAFRKSFPQRFSRKGGKALTLSDNLSLPRTT
jgi:hypothetical protein